MKKVIPGVSVLIVVLLLIIYLSNKETPKTDEQVLSSPAKITPSEPNNSTALDQPSHTPSPLRPSDSTVTLLADSAEPTITYSTKSDPSIQPINSDSDPANQLVDNH